MAITRMHTVVVVVGIDFSFPSFFFSVGRIFELAILILVLFLYVRIKMQYYSFYCKVLFLCNSTVILEVNL